MVRTLTMLVGELERLGHTVLVIGPDRFRTLPCPSYPDIRLAVAAAAAAGSHAGRFRSQRAAHRNRGPAGPVCRALGQNPRPAVHHGLSHALRRVSARPHTHAGGDHLCLAAALPQPRGRHAGRDRQPARRSGPARLPAPAAMVARRRSGRLPPGHARTPTQPDLPVGRAHRGGKEPRRLPGPGPAGREARGGRRARCWRHCGATIRMSASPAS